MSNALQRVSGALVEAEHRGQLGSGHDVADAEAMLAAAGVTVMGKGHGPGKPGSTIHEMGTAHMGTDPKTSVLNGYSQAHDVPNLFITDGSAMASSKTLR